MEVVIFVKEMCMITDRQLLAIIIILIFTVTEPTE